MNLNLTLAKVYKDQDPTGWWMSEKLDGVRAHWNGKNFYSRTGKLWRWVPSSFRKRLPPEALDGELWMGRGTFQTLVGIVKRQKNPSEKDWEQVEYHVFDAPRVKGKFRERYAWMKELEAKYPDGPMRVLEQTECKDRAHLMRTVDNIVGGRKRKHGFVPGEGVMLRNPDMDYEQKRTSNLLKVKRFIDDEAVVLGTTRGQGRLLGTMGALLVKWKGKQFKVGSGFSDAERHKPPARGSVITFRYQELTKGGIPRFPTFVAVRDYE
jgi:DNA ligase-1